VLHPNVPFGGMRESGVGRELGPNGIENYLETKVRVWKTRILVGDTFADHRLTGCSSLLRGSLELAVRALRRNRFVVLVDQMKLYK
jgi:hypothetical protein